MGTPTSPSPAESDADLRRDTCVEHMDDMGGCVVRRVKVERDQRLTNASTLTIEREDHTIGNLLRM